MGYTPEMQELIKRVEATRAERVEQSKRGEDFTPMTLDQRAEVLEKFHLEDGEKHYRDCQRYTAGFGLGVSHTIHTLGQAAVMDTST